MGDDFVDGVFDGYAVMHRNFGRYIFFNHVIGGVMGLDMYLHSKGNNSDIVDAISKQFDDPWYLEQNENGTRTIGYWRKANQIHSWISKLKECPGNNCEEISLSTEDMLALREVCQKVLDNKSLAPELLPSQDGFFFGSTEYDEYYFGDIEYTIKLIDCIKSVDGWEKCEFFYYAWW